MRQLIVVVVIITAVVLGGCGGGGGGNGGGGNGEGSLAAWVRFTIGGSREAPQLVRAGSSCPVSEEVTHINVEPVALDAAGNPMSVSGIRDTTIVSGESLITLGPGFYSRSMVPGPAVMRVTLEDHGSATFTLDVVPRSNPILFLAMTANGHTIPPLLLGDGLNFKVDWATYGTSAARFRLYPRQLMPSGAVVSLPADQTEGATWSYELDGRIFVQVSAGSNDFMPGPMARQGIGTTVKLVGTRAGARVFERECIIAFPMSY